VREAEGVLPWHGQYRTAGVWSEREVAQAIGSDVRAAHALVSLPASGLIHLEAFVFPTRAAVRFHQLEEAQ